MKAPCRRVVRFLNWVVDKIWRPIIDWISLEPVLRHHANGGAIILLRTLWITNIVYALVLLTHKSLLACPDPSSDSLVCKDAGAIVASTIHWFGAIFAAVYVSLYARFSAQWTYLANVYNRIKETQTRMTNDADARKSLAQWKAGFIEDAQDLHLAVKPIFASVIHAWSIEPGVKEAFCDHTPGRETRWKDLMARVEAVCERHDNIMARTAESRLRTKETVEAPSSRK